MAVIIEFDPALAGTLRSSVGDQTVVLDNLDTLRHHLAAHPDEEVVVLGPSVDLEMGLELVEHLRVTRPALGVVLVRRRVDTTVLNDSIRAGIREVVEERNLAGLNAAVARIHEVARAMRAAGNIETPDQGNLGKLLTVFSAKGGCGKTTFATNVAAVLAQAGQKVCLVDLDLAFGDVAIAMQLKPTRTIADTVPIAHSLDREALASLLTSYGPGLDVLIAPVRPDVKEVVPAPLVGKILDLLRSEYDWVVVDTPPAFDDQVLHAFDRSDHLALLATLDVPALKNLKLTLETLALLNYPKDRWKVVINRADSKVGLSIGDVEKALGTHISGQVPSSRDVPASINRGVPIVEEDARNPVSQSLRRFVEQQLLGPSVASNGSGPQTAAAAEKRGTNRRRSRQ
jgi:pilus assembly protein CpaE